MPAHRPVARPPARSHVVGVTREERLKAALRANLAKRKARERDAAPPDVADGAHALYPLHGGQKDNQCEQDT